MKLMCIKLQNLLLARLALYTVVLSKLFFCEFCELS